MKKLLLLLGIGVGFVAGSRAGKAPYEKLMNTLRGVTGRPEVENVVATVSQKVDDVTDKVNDATDKVGAKVGDATDKVAAKVDDVTDKAGAKVDEVTAKVSSASSPPTK